MLSPLDKLRQDNDRLKDELNFLRQMVAGLEHRMNSIARFENLEHAAGGASGTSKTVQVSIPAPGGGTAGDLIADYLYRNRDYVTARPDEDPNTFVKGSPTDAIMYYLANVLITQGVSGVNRLQINAGAYFGDTTQAGTMKIAFKTVNLGDGNVKYAFPAGAWC